MRLTLTRFYLILSLFVIGCKSEDVPDHEPTNAPTSDKATADPAELTRLENHAAGLMGQFKYDEAVTIYDRLLTLKEELSESKIDLAIARLNRRQDEDLAVAERLLDEAIEAAPEDLRAPYCRALLHFNGGEIGRALELFRRVAKKDPADGYAKYYIGQCLLLQGEHSAALEQFEAAERSDPYLRSAYYGAFQAALRLKKQELAQDNLEQFQRLATNPRARLAELKYTRMGPKASVNVSEARNKELATLPAGPLFEDPVALTTDAPSELDWTAESNSSRPPSVTIADINGDGQSDVFISRVVDPSNPILRNAVFLQNSGEFQFSADHPLSAVSDVNGALWGDYDDDGFVDVYLCRQGQDRLWHQQANGVWADASQEASIDSRDSGTVDGVCFDSDHDGDLDYLLLDDEGNCELLNNDREGKFLPIGKELGITGPVEGGGGLVVADLDRDNDADIILLGETPPHRVFRNDRLWRYHDARGFDEFLNSKTLAAAAADIDADGQVELITVSPNGLLLWEPNESQQWNSSIISEHPVSPDAESIKLAIYDFDGDSRLEILWQIGSSVRIVRVDGSELTTIHGKQLAGTVSVIALETGPQIVACQSANKPVIWKGGPGRFPFALIRLQGRTDKADEMRSNSSGIGVQASARIGSRWMSWPSFRSESGPGQNLQPYPVGLHGAETIDYLRLVWPDGVSQSELDLPTDRTHVISETQRQAGSCPLLFVWNGESFQFVADVLGAGGMGFNLGRGDYYPPRPKENLLLPDDVLKPKDGKYVLKLGEPMEEICYFDAVRLVAYDLPEEVKMTLDERFGAADPLPTGNPYFYRLELLPSRAVNNRGEDVTLAVQAADGVAVPIDRGERQFVGLTRPHTVTLSFDTPLDDFEAPVLLFDGWVEYAYSQTAFAAWQAGREYLEPTIEARGSDGQWHVVVERFGYMAGTSRRSTMPLDPKSLPAGTHQLRLSSNMEIYWDRLAVIDVELEPQFVRQELKLRTALVDDVGYARRLLLNQRNASYDYDDRPPLQDARHPAGFYTALGEALDLVRFTDNAVAIIGPGEELHLEYESPEAKPRAGWSRYYVVEADGWCKDADLFTKDAGTVEPLPTRGVPMSAEQIEYRDLLHGKYNTRYKLGW